MKKRTFIIIGIVLTLLLITAAVAYFVLLGKDGTKTKDETTTQKDTTTVEQPNAFDETEPVLIWSVDHESKLQSLAVSPDGETVAVGEFLTSYIYHLSDGQLEQVTVYKHSADDLEFSPDGEILAAGLSVYGVLLTNPEDGSEIWNPNGGYNNSVAFSPNGDLIATGNRSGIVWLWDIESQEQILALEEDETSWIKSLEYHPSGDYVVATHWGRVGQKGYINIWDIQAEEIVERIDLNYTIGSAGHPFKFSPDGDIMAYVDMDEERNYWLYLLDFETKEEILKLDHASRDFRNLDFSPDGSMIAVGERLSKPVTILDAQTGELIYTFDQEGMEAGVSNWIVALSFTPDGKHVAVIRGDNSLELWRLPGGEVIQSRPRDISNPPPLPSDVLFNANEAVLKTSANEELEAFAQELYAEFKSASITFIGHTTSYAEEDFNLELSTNRANAVKEWFENWARENNVDGWELFAQGKGSSELKVPDFDSEGNFLESAGELNRRVEIEIEVL